jgi:general secretion pathway protein I
MIDSDPARRRGFTLIEVLVALAVVAVALSAGMRAIVQSADGASALKARTLALWVAENRLAQAQFDDPAPATGTTTGEDAQAGVLFAWKRNVDASPNPAFRKVEIIVTDVAQPGYALARLVGYVGSGLR